MNRTATDKATGEICQFLNDHMEKVVPAEWRDGIHDIIERACGADELLDLESSIAAFAGKAHAVIQRAREQMSDEEVEIADRNAAEILAQCARGREDDCSQSKRHRTSNPINEGSSPSEHSKSVEDCWHVWNDNRIKRADNWTEACLQFAEYFRERSCGQDGVTAEQARKLCDSWRHDPEIGQAVQDIQSYKPDGLARIIAHALQTRSCGETAWVPPGSYTCKGCGYKWILAIDPKTDMCPACTLPPSLPSPPTGRTEEK